MTDVSDDVLFVLALVAALVIGAAFGAAFGATLGAKLTAQHYEQAERVECGNQVPGR